MKPKIIVLVGSKNQVKINSVKLAFGHFFDCEVIGVETDSKVGKQPFDQEAFKGARNRALQAMKMDKCDFAIGIEGGIIHVDGHHYAFAAICLLAANSLESSATTGLFPLPDEAIKLIEEGAELGDAMDKLTGTHGSKHGLGAVGILTRGCIDRTKLYEHGVILALIPHLNDRYGWLRYQHYQ